MLVFSLRSWVDSRHALWNYEIDAGTLGSYKVSMKHGKGVTQQFKLNCSSFHFLSLVVLISKNCMSGCTSRLGISRVLSNYSKHSHGIYGLVL